MKTFYRAIDLAMQTDYKTKIDKLVDNIEMTIGERLSMNAVRKKIREFLAPYIASFAKQQKIARVLGKLDFHRLQEEIISDREKLRAELSEVDSRRDVYQEAIKGRFLDIRANEVLMEQNTLLCRELERMKNKYEPHLSSSPNFAGQSLPNSRI